MGISMTRCSGSSWSVCCWGIGGFGQNSSRMMPARCAKAVW